MTTFSRLERCLFPDPETIHWNGDNLVVEEYSTMQDEFLDEAFALTDEVYVTEYGVDAKVCRGENEGFALDEEDQADYLNELTQRIREYSIRMGREIKGIFCWSDLRRQLEWENGLESQLGILDPIVNVDRQVMVGARRLLLGFWRKLMLLKRIWNRVSLKRKCGQSRD